MNEIRVIINGLGGVGCRMLRSICAREDMKFVGGVDVMPEKIGKDAGEVAGIGNIGVKISSSLEELCSSVDADVVVNLASSAEADLTFRQMLPAIRRGMNVLVANSATFDLYNGERALAEEIDAKCRQYGVSYLGMGNTQSIERIILLMSESVEHINTLSFTHWADVSEFSPVSNANQLGISLPKAEYEVRLKSGQAPALVKWREDLVWALAKRIGWKLTRVDYDRALKTDDNGVIYANTSRLRGYEEDSLRIAMDWVFLLDKEHNYYEHIKIDGEPAVDAKINFTPDRGKTATSNILVNALPFVVQAKPGYISTFDAPICSRCVPEESAGRQRNE